ncbi:MAG: response regulator [Luteolibacter sp.]
MKKDIHLLMVEDHADYREGIRLALETQSDFVLTQIFGTAEHALRSFEQDQSAEIILLDLNLPGMSGLEAIPWFRKYSPDVKIIILSQSNQESDVLQAIQLGATGYLLKEATLDQIVEGIRNVSIGYSTLDPSVAKFILKTLQTTNHSPDSNSEQLLSKREVEVLQMISEGLIKKEIAEKLDVEVTTVATYVTRIFNKLDVVNAPAAVAKAYRKGLI